MKFLLLLFAAAASATSAETLTSTSMVPASALRGVPPAVRLEIRNIGTTPLVIPRTYMVEVVLPSGERFSNTVPPDSDASPAFTLPEDVRTEPDLRPGETRVIYIPLGESLGSPGLMGHLELTEPGEYTYRLVLDDRLAPLGARVVDPVIVTEPARFTVEAGSEEDVLVWESLMRLNGQRNLWSMGYQKYAKAAKELLEVAPGSGYRAHLLVGGWSVDRVEAIAHLQEALEVMGDNPLLFDRLSLALIASRRLLADTYRNEKNMTAASDTLRGAEIALDEFKPKTAWGAERIPHTREQLRLAREYLRPDSR